MLKHLIAGLTALSLTLAPAAPVHAQGMDRENVGKLIFGIAAIAVLSAAIDNSRRNDRATTRSQTVHDRSNQNNGWGNGNRQRAQDQSRYRDLPRECLRSVETRFGTQRLFVQRCLERNYARANRLPERCAVRIYTTDGPRSGFDPLCLREQGYQIARR